MVLKIVVPRGGPQGRGLWLRARLVGAVATALVLMAGAAAGRAETRPGSSAWVRSGHAEARLLAGGPSVVPGDPQRLAGVEIQLDPGAITYWRNPGDSGMAPSFDPTGSTNVATVSVDYPAPQKLDEAGSEVFGYADRVVFPLRITAKDPTVPVALALTVDYAVCAAQCLPAKAHLTLDLPDVAAPDSAAMITAALSRVPRETKLGAMGLPAIESVTTDTPSGLSVRARVGSVSADLFVEGPEGWYFQVGKPSAPAGKSVTFPVAALERPAGGSLENLPLRLTLTDEAVAIDVKARTTAAPRVDGSAPKL